jgi:hypothetical protein
MKRSRAVDIPLVMRVATAAVLLGCGADHRAEAQRCVTRDWEVVPDANCEAQPTAPGHAPIGHSYFWYYGGRGFGIGERASGGSTIPPTSGVVTRPNSGGGRFSAPGGVSSRGGFGSTAGGAHSSLGG